MTCCEPGRKAAYHEDLRWRMIWQKEVIGPSIREAAKNLGVDPATVSRTSRLLLSTGSVTKHQNPGNRRPTKKLTDAVRLLIIHRPQIYLRELRSTVFNCTGLDLWLPEGNEF